MKNITVESRLKRFSAPHKLIASSGKGIVIQYACPKDPIDLKRWGKEMNIVGPGFSVTLDGRGIRSIKSVLERAGELV